MKAHLYMIGAVVAWGIQYPLMKQCAERVGVLMTGAVMFLVGAGLLGAHLAVRGELRAPACGWGRLFAIGAVGVAINTLSLVATTLTPVANVATLSRMDSLFSLILAAAVFGERVDGRIFLFVPVMLAGVGLLTGMISRTPQVGSLGDLLAVLSALGVSLNALLIKKAVQRTSPALVGMLNCMINGAFFLALLFFGTAHARSLGIPWGSLTLLGVTTYLFFIAYYAALRALPVWEALLMFIGVPVVAALTGWLWLREVPRGAQWTGMLLVCAGAAGIILLRRSPDAPKSGIKEVVHE